jgi:serine/threonine protein kinase
VASERRLVAGRYFLESVIGTGGMGVVWRAYDLRLARWVAIKEIRFDQYVTPQERDEIKQRAMVEALSAGRLFHPNIVAVYDAVEDADQPWVVMRLVEGRSLRQLVKEDGPLEPMAAVRLGLGLLDALDAAHAAGVIHRDVKPSNVLVQADGRPLLSDFSIATVGDPQAAIRTVAVMGSPGYVAPERLHGAPGGAPADLFGLGATLFFVVEGAGPFARGDTMACLVATVCEPHPRPRRAGPLTPVIDALLAKNVADRLDAAGAREALLKAARPRRRRRAVPPHPLLLSRRAYLPPWRAAPIDTAAILASTASAALDSAEPLAGTARLASDSASAEPAAGPTRLASDPDSAEPPVGTARPDAAAASADRPAMPGGRATARFTADARGDRPRPATLVRRRIGRRGRVALVTSAAALLLPMAAALASLTSTPSGPNGERIVEARPVPPGIPATNPPRKGLTLAMPDLASPNSTPPPEALPGAVLTTEPVARTASPTPKPSGGGGAAPTTRAPRPPARVTGVAVNVTVAADCTYTVDATATVSGATMVVYQVTAVDGSTSTHTTTATAAGTVTLPVSGGGPLTTGPARVQVTVLEPTRLSATGSADVPPECSPTATPSATASITPKATDPDPALTPSPT